MNPEKILDQFDVDSIADKILEEIEVVEKQRVEKLEKRVQNLEEKVKDLETVNNDKLKSLSTID